MALTTQEPSTKFWGPNHPYKPIAGSNMRVLATFWNLQPGQFWNPAWTLELHAPHVLIPDPLNEWFFLATAHFTYAFFQSFAYNRLSIRTVSGRYQAYMFNIHHGINQWCRNEVIAPAGVYSYNGTATVSRFTV